MRFKIREIVSSHYLKENENFLKAMTKHKEMFPEDQHISFDSLEGSDQILDESQERIDDLGFNPNMMTFRQPTQLVDSQRVSLQPGGAQR